MGKPFIRAFRTIQLSVMNVGMGIRWLMTVLDVVVPIGNGVAHCQPVRRSIAVHRVFYSMDGWKILMPELV